MKKPYEREKEYELRFRVYKNPARKKDGFGPWQYRFFTAKDDGDARKKFHRRIVRIKGIVRPRHYKEMSEES